jgi:hypothetical protein
MDQMNYASRQAVVPLKRRMSVGTRRSISILGDSKRKLETIPLKENEKIFDK